jgi:uncharacterized protein (UPF0548 family)
VFIPSPPNQFVVQRYLAKAAQREPDCPDLLGLRDGLKVPRLPWGFSHDVSLSEIGNGAAAFARARLALEQWEQFNLGWVWVANPQARVRERELIAVQAQTAGLWSLSLSRITETVDTPERFGFLYATTSMHVEEGQERFVLEYDRASERVLYMIEAVSRPRALLARLGWPLARAMQHKFARESHARMRAAVGS